MRFGSRTVGVLLAVTAVVASGGYVAAGESPSDIIAMRHDRLKDLGVQAKAIGAQMKSGTLDRSIMTEAAKKIAATARELPTWFPKGTGPDSGVKTLAKPEIWAQPDDFKTVAEAFPPEADKLVEVVASGDAAAIGAQLRATGKACHDCHKTFRTDPPDEPH